MTLSFSLTSVAWRRVASSLALGLFLFVGACASEDDSLARLSEMSKYPAAEDPSVAPRYRPPAAAAPNRGGPSGVAQGRVGAYPASDSVTRAPLTDLPVPARQAPVSQTGKAQVALLLPLSGANAAMGQAMLNAAQLAVFEMAPQDFELMPRDTGATRESALVAAQDALASGAQLLIGPLFASDVVAVKPALQQTGASMLALSTDVSLADKGAFVMGFAPAPQVERVVGYVAKDGATRFAAVIPNTPYGKLVRKAFETAVQAHGGTIAAIVTPQAVKELDSAKEPFDALFLPLDGAELNQVASALETVRLDRQRVKILGTGLWDEPSQKPALLLGALYAASEPEPRLAFMESYKKVYHKYPPRLATLAYDATALAAVLSGRGLAFDSANLTNPNGFAGVDGIFRLKADGQAERGLAVLAVTSGAPEIVDPAPSSFVR